MTRGAFICSILAATLGGCNIIRAQTTAGVPGGSVDGVITGPSGPVGGALVNLTPADNSYHATSSDAQGYYAIDDVAAGPATLVVGANGYRAYSVMLTVVAKQSVTANVSLTPS